MFGLNNRESDESKVVDSIYKNFIKTINDYKNSIETEYNDILSNIEEVNDKLSEIDIDNVKQKLEDKKLEINNILIKFKPLLNLDSKFKEMQDKLFLVENSYKKAVNEISSINIPDIKSYIEKRKIELTAKLELELSTIDIKKQIKLKINEEFNKILPDMKKEVLSVVEEKVGMMIYELGFNIQSFLDNNVEIKMNNPLLLVEMMIDVVNKQEAKDKITVLNEDVLKAWRSKIKLVLPDEIKTEKDTIIFAIDEYIDNLFKKGTTKSNNLIEALRYAQHKLERLEENNKKELLSNKEHNEDITSTDIIKEAYEIKDKIDFGV
jgi:hypothetical protein